MALPDNIRDLEGPLYVVTHAREYPFAEWRTAMVSCLVGEHGEDAKQMVRRWPATWASRCRRSIGNAAT